MRFFIKLIFIFLVFLGLSYYYNIYTFENGLAEFRNNNQDITDEEMIEYFEDPKVSFIKVPFSNKIYFSFIVGDGKTVVARYELKEGYTVDNELSLIPLGIGVIAIFAILLNKKPYRD